MTIGQLKQLLNQYPEYYEVVIDEYGENVVQILQELHAGKVSIWPEEQFGNIIGEIDFKSNQKNCLKLGGRFDGV